jgi:hypothetical protein
MVARENELDQHHQRVHTAGVGKATFTLAVHIVITSSSSAGRA